MQIVRFISYYTLPDQLKPLPDNKILHWSKLEQIADGI